MKISLKQLKELSQALIEVNEEAEKIESNADALLKEGKTQEAEDIRTDYAKKIANAYGLAIALCLETSALSQEFLLSLQKKGLGLPTDSLSGIIGSLKNGSAKSNSTSDALSKLGNSLLKSSKSAEDKTLDDLLSFSDSKKSNKDMN